MNGVIITVCVSIVVARSSRRVRVRSASDRAADAVPIFHVLSCPTNQR